ncbi:[LSU ribosomal protein L11P]-lysine N-methyltransferase [Clostridium amylolyticum]|uniref:Ribosomal protein L11 methyltransferase n=1 Tax=Clostridium amylolyticum TaxID=1121298 RepID=A0A1M6CNS4_9CLOT|nr:50S ribosomal protein L11 methyltransferase [Clostridium amylolyticum]SHI62501.1 [LSU ribosomal protein L11P]-lysine N-methyltransferase [Clostridium amylolyticum]
MQGKWIEIKVITTSEALEPVSGIFYSMDCKGVAIEDPEDILSREQGPLTWDFADINILEYGGKAASIKAYFSEDDNPSTIVDYIEEKLKIIKESGINIGEGKVLYAVVKEEDWANNWKKYYKPTKIGKHIVVKPIWENYSNKDNELVIELDPGMAFGTGTHETTRMCVEALEKNVEANSVIYDIGTGSGILAIAAAKLGAKEVLGVDLDPVAVDSAAQNVQHNKLNNIKIIEGNLVEVVEGKADIVVANIIAEIICILIGDVKKVLKTGGLFISSGIIHERREMVIDKLENSGFQVLEVNKDGEWNCITAILK